MEMVQATRNRLHLNTLANPFGNTYFGTYAHGVLQVPKGISYDCEVVDCYDKPYVYQALYKNGKLVDKNDPQCLKDHRDFLKEAKGKVLVTNAGLGGFVYRLIKKPNVHSVTVVEPCYGIFELIEPSFSKHLDKVNFIYGAIHHVNLKPYDCVYDGKTIYKLQNG